MPTVKAMEFFKRLNIKKVVIHNFWLKLTSLIIAILVWLYVSGVITGGARNV